MARETKVGLIVGLGVILFVGVFVSDYLSVPQHKEALAGEELANFHDQTTNQPQFVLSREDETTQARSTDPALSAMAALERAERRDGPPVERRIDNTYEEPPFPRFGPGLTSSAEDVTPVAEQAYTPPEYPLGQLPADDRNLAAEHQLSSERIGPGADTLEHVARVEIPETPLIRPQPRVVLHTVRSGETLSEIARKHYDGDGNMWRSIRDANPGKVGSNGEVREGAELVIPKRSAEAADPAAELSERAAGENTRPPRRRVRMITVKEGQTLSEIAQEHLGAGNKWRQIMEVNQDVLDKPEHLRAGMKLRIPADAEEEVVEAANEALNEERRAESEQPSARDGGRTYTVKSGDSLTRIAEKELGDGNRYQEIYKANKDKLRSPDDIKVGMKLRLPAR